MAEYIKREAAVKSVLRMRKPENSVAQNRMLSIIQMDVLKLPTADVAPVVHGRWILEREPNGKPYCFHCSVCDSDYHCIGIVVASDYCPNCGAKMDGGDTDEAD